MEIGRTQFPESITHFAAAIISPSTSSGEYSISAVPCRYRYVPWWNASPPVVYPPLCSGLMISVTAMQLRAPVRSTAIPLVSMPCACKEDRIYSPIPSCDTFPRNPVFSPRRAAPCTIFAGEPPTDFVNAGISANVQPAFVVFISIPARPANNNSMISISCMFHDVFLLLTFTFSFVEFIISLWRFYFKFRFLSLSIISY